jgi:perosamine synthetase
VHLFAQTCNCEEISELCENWIHQRLRPIVRCEAQQQAKRNICSVRYFSVFPNKNLSGLVDSDLVCTDKEALYERMKMLRMQGMNPKYFYPYIGGNFRMDALQAVLPNVKLGHLDEYLANRVRNTKFYLEKLADLEDTGLIALPKVAPGNSHI